MDSVTHLKVGADYFPVSLPRQVASEEAKLKSEDETLTVEVPHYYLTPKAEPVTEAITPLLRNSQ